MRAGQVGRDGGRHAVVAERLAVRPAVGRRAAGPDLTARLGRAAAGRYDALEGDHGAERAADARTQLRHGHANDDEERDEQSAAEEQDDQNERPAARRSWSHCSHLKP